MLQLFLSLMSLSSQWLAFSWLFVGFFWLLIFSALRSLHLFLLLLFLPICPLFHPCPFSHARPLVTPSPSPISHTPTSPIPLIWLSDSHQFTLRLLPPLYLLIPSFVKCENSSSSLMIKSSVPPIFVSCLISYSDFHFSQFSWSSVLFCNTPLPRPPSVPRSPLPLHYLFPIHSSPSPDPPWSLK